MSTVFRYKRDFNADIGSWGVSNVTSMNYMFDGATSFNKDISNISSEPSLFSNNSPLTEVNKPAWGTCSSLGINDQYFTNLSIYPNPVENNLFISGNTTTISVSIYNVLDKEVLCAIPKIKIVIINPIPIWLVGLVMCGNV